MHKVRGTEEHDKTLSVLSGDWDASQGSKGEEQTKATEAGRGKKGPLDARNPGAGMDLGSCQRRKKGGETDEGRKPQARARNYVWPPRKVGNSRQAVQSGRWGRCPGG